MTRRWWPLLVALAACARPAERPAPPPPAGVASAPAPTDAEAPPPIIVDEGAAEAGPALVPADGKGVRLSRYAVAASSALTAPNGAAVAIVRREQVELRVGTTLQLEARATSTAEFTSDSRFLLVRDESATLRAFSIPDGQLAAEVRKVERLAWTHTGSLLLYRRHGTCELFVFDLARRTERAVGARACGHLLGIRAEPATVLLAEPGQFLGHFSAFFRLELEPERRAELLRIDDAMRTAHHPTASRSLDRLCFHVERSTLRCLDTRTGKQVELASSGAGQWPTLDESGRRIVFLVQEQREGPEDLYLGDAATGKSRRLLESKYEWWTFLPGNQRIVGHGGQQRFVVADLAEGWVMELGERGQEYEGVRVVPGDPSRFYIGRERHATRDIYFVELGR